MLMLMFANCRSVWLIFITFTDFLFFINHKASWGYKGYLKNKEEEPKIKNNLKNKSDIKNQNDLKN